MLIVASASSVGGINGTSPTEVLVPWGAPVGSAPFPSSTQDRTLLFGQSPRPRPYLEPRPSEAERVGQRPD